MHIPVLRPLTSQRHCNFWQCLPCNPEQSRRRRDLHRSRRTQPRTQRNIPRNRQIRPAQCNPRLLRQTPSRPLHIKIPPSLTVRRWHPQLPQVHLSRFAKFHRVHPQHRVVTRRGSHQRIKANRRRHTKPATIIRMLAQQIHAPRSLIHRRRIHPSRHQMPLQ